MQYTYEMFLQDIQKLGELIIEVAKEKRCEKVLLNPIERGGIIPAYFLERYIKNYMPCQTASSLIFSRDTRLDVIVDDIWDTGKTLEQRITMFNDVKTHYAEQNIVVCVLLDRLLEKEKRLKMPYGVISARELGDSSWVNFFWEVFDKQKGVKDANN